MKFDKNYFFNNIDTELKLNVDTYNKVLEQLNQSKDLTIDN